MISLSKTHKAECLSFPAHPAPRMRRSVWTAAPLAKHVGAEEIGHETEVMRAITLAVPVSLLLWAPLLLVASRWF